MNCLEKIALVNPFNIDFRDSMLHYLLCKISQLGQNFMDQKTSDDDIFMVCSFCLMSQEETMCDILIDKKCSELNACLKCFKKNLNVLCKKCPDKLKDHHKKLKNTRKEETIDRGAKNYEKEFKERSTWEDVDPELTDVMAYIYRKKSGNEYEAMQKKLRNTLNELKKRENQIFGSIKQMKIPQFLGVRENNDPTGKDACGYRNSYDKGMKFLFDSFSI